MLDHPNVLKYIHDFETTSRKCIVMQYIGSASLDQHVQSLKLSLLPVSIGLIEEIEARGIFKKIVQGVEYCHSLGVSHRDLKLENIMMIKKSNSPVIIDFGFSSRTGGTTIEVKEV